jgi:polysaccharide pyruvyl transferase CsaB
MPVKLTISGYYGYGNCGDEAVLAGMLETLPRVGLDADVTVLSANPELTRAMHPGVNVARRFGPCSVLRAIVDCDALLSGGGSLLQDVTSTRSVLYYLTIIRLALLFRRKTMVYAQGIGPLIRESSRSAVAQVLSRVDAITVRDPDSLSLLESVGVALGNAECVADPSFLVQPDAEGAGQLLVEAGVVDDFAVVSLRNWPGSQLAEIGRGIANALDRIGLQIVTLPMQTPDDVEACNVVPGGNLITGAGNPRVAKGIVAQSSLVVGMRLHALMFAASGGVPFVPLVYDPKVASFARMTGQHEGVEVATTTAKAVSESIMQTWERRSERSEALRAAMPKFEEMALRPGRLLVNLLGQQAR